MSVRISEANVLRNVSSHFPVYYYYYHYHYYYIFLTGKPNPACILYINDGSSEGEIELFVINMGSWDKVF